jgi:hypothetical protein
MDPNMAKWHLLGEKLKFSNFSLSDDVPLVSWAAGISA